MQVGFQVRESRMNQKGFVFSGKLHTFHGQPTEFGRSRIAGQIPPAPCWPERLEPLCAVVAVGRRGVYNPVLYEPDRIHLFFGDEASFRALEPLAVDLLKLRDDVVANYGMKFVRNIGKTIFGGSDAIDEWGREIHRRAWTQPTSPIHTKPKAMCGGEPIDVDPTDKAFTDYLSFSRLECDVFTATAAIVDTYLGWLDKGPPSSCGALPSRIRTIGVVQSGSPEAAVAEKRIGSTPSFQFSKETEVATVVPSLRNRDEKCYR